MYMVAASLTAPEGSPSPDGTVVSDVFWSLALPEDGLEHLRLATHRPARVDLVVFLRAPGEQEATKAARRLCDRVIATSSVLSGWRVDAVAPVDYETGTGHSPDGRPAGTPPPENLPEP
ncbi:hypothetical protein ACWDTT_11045 [Streptosporangium sandarakinum]|uniref:hypothetical protein n=1 Tax=Streptosporangium TaxID=2000 RepID=UPI0031F8CC95